MQEKNKLSRRQFLLAAGATGLTLGLAACVPAAPGAPAADTGSDAAAPSTEPITLIFNMRAGGEESEPAIYVRRPAAFMEEHPNVKIELAPIPGGEYEAKVLTSASAGTLGDIMFTSDVWTLHTRLVKLGVIAAADDWQEANGVSKDEWLPAAVATLTHDGKMYGMPKNSHPGEAYIAINHKLFEEAGIPIPETYGATHEDITAWAEATTRGPEDARDVYGVMITSNGIQSLVNGPRQFGSYENNEEGTECLADSDGWMAWVTWLKDLYDKKLTTIQSTLPTGGTDALFVSGRLAMNHRQRSFYRATVNGLKEAAEPFEWSAIQAPRTPEAKGWVASVDTHSATTSTRYPNEAMALGYALADQLFARYVAEDQGYLTARVDDLETVKDIMTPFLELQYQCMTEEEKFHQPANARGKEVETVYINELDKIWLGEAELNAAFMQNLKDAVDEVLDKPF
jgi:ABC-type glycerol-3-phosphate transport system substrate-binding protein